MSTLVEAMARAMCAHDCKECPDQFDIEWECEGGYYLGFALAALKAMREPEIDSAVVDAMNDVWL